MRKGFTEDPGEIAPHLEEWRSKYQGHTPLLLKPADHGASVSGSWHLPARPAPRSCPRAAIPGLVGGQIPLHGEVLLSAKRMNRIRAVDESGMTLTVEAGVTLAEVQRAADDRTCCFR